MNKYFTNCNCIEQLKKEYKKLALMYHPDRPTGNLETMKMINSEYSLLFPLLKNKHEKINEDGTTEMYTSTTGTSEDAGEFINIINDLIKYTDITVSIVGSWLWVEGNTKPIKDILKKYKFFWNSKRTLWQLKPQEDKYKKYKNSSKSDDEIKNMFGCKTFKEGNRNLSLT